MLQEIWRILGMLQTKMLQTFEGKKIVANTNVANFLGNSAMLQKPNVAKKKPMSGGDRRYDSSKLIVDGEVRGTTPLS